MEDAIDRLFEMLYGKDAQMAKNFWKKVKEVLLALGECHIPYPYSFLNRVKKDSLKELNVLAQELAGKAPDDRMRKELVIWTEYLINFKELFDTYHAGKLTEKDVDAFVAWIHSHRETRVFVQDKFDMYFPALHEALAKGFPWLHFNFDWEDDYIRKHEESNFFRKKI